MKKRSHPRGDWTLLAEIGGTHTRLALTRSRAGEPRLDHLQILPTPEHSIEPFLREYLRAVGPAGHPKTCAVAVAGRVRRTGEESSVTMTNLPLSISSKRVAKVTGARSVMLCNDLAAVAAALPLLRDRDRQAIGKKRRARHGLQLVIGVGTGFGLAALTADGAVIESEAGHAALAAVSDAEKRWLERLGAHGRVRIETLLSGPGLSRLHALVTDEPSLPADIVVSRAQAGDPRARETVKAFSIWLGQVVGDMILTYGAWGGVHMTGGVLARMGTLFDTGTFRQSLEDKAPFERDLAAVPVYRILHPQPALLGLARLIRQRKPPARAEG